MKKKSFKSKTGLFVTVWLLVFAALLFFVVRPMWHAVEAHAANIRAVRADTAHIHKRLDSIRAFKELRDAPSLVSLEEEIAYYQERIELLETELEDPDADLSPQTQGELTGKIIEYQTDLLRLQRQFEGGEISTNDEARNLGQVAGFFVDRETPVEFIVFIEQLADQADVLLTTSALPAPPSTQPAEEPMRFLFAAEGTFPNISRFMSLVEHAPYLITIEEFQIEPDTPEGQTPEEGIIPEFVQVSITVNVHATIF